ncbi:MAG TPA: SapB/AmfS family lanthipeptide [Solirubrobacteraceae bacterium]|nr:SapB/AmfS family lanthipeptide [Solirubrobacteraceae bacterium]
MSVLDLQGLKGPDRGAKPTKGSRASQGCGQTTASTLSLLCNVP